MTGAVASAAETAPPTVAYTGAPATAEAAGQVAQVMAMLKPPVNLDDAPVHLDGLLPGEAPLVFGAAAEERCDGEPVDGETYRASLAVLYQATISLDRDINRLVELTRAMQSCLTEVVDASELARPSYLGGVVAASDGNLEGSFAAFQEVFAIQSGFPWDNEYPPKALKRFEEASSMVEGLDPAHVRVVVPGGDQVWIDGKPVDEPGRDQAIAPGRHVLQIGGADGAVTFTTVVIVEPGNPVVVLDPALAAADPADEAAFVVSIEALFVLLGEGGLAPAPDYLMTLGGTPGLWRWDGAQGALHPVELSKSATRVAMGDVKHKTPKAGAGQKSPVGAVLIAAGAGLLAVGAVTSAATSADLEEFNAEVESGDERPFPTAADADPSSYEAYGRWEQKVASVKASYGILTAGGVVMAIAIPINIGMSRRKAVVTLNTTLLGDPGPDAGSGVQGFQLGVSIR